MKKSLYEQDGGKKKNRKRNSPTIHGQTPGTWVGGSIPRTSFKILRIPFANSTNLYVFFFNLPFFPIFLLYKAHVNFLGLPYQRTIITLDLIALNLNGVFTLHHHFFFFFFLRFNSKVSESEGSISAQLVLMPDHRMRRGSKWLK